MRKGFSTLLIIILILFLSLPVLFWIYSSNKQNGDTKGIASAKNGFAINITSEMGNWDLKKYLCETKTACLSAVTSGTKLDTVSGGKTDKSSVYVSYSSNYSDYEYIKLTVTPGWSSTFREFEVIDKGDIPNTEIFELDGTVVVLIPLQYVSEVFNYSAHFSD